MSLAEIKQTIANYENTLLNLRERAANFLKDAEAKAKVIVELAKLPELAQELANHQSTELNLRHRAQSHLEEAEHVVGLLAQLRKDHDAAEKKEGGSATAAKK